MSIEQGMINSIDDFCVWGSPNANETVADTEEEMVSWKLSKARRLDVLKRFSNRSPTAQRLNTAREYSLPARFKASNCACRHMFKKISDLLISVCR